MATVKTVSEEAQPTPAQIPEPRPSAEDLPETLIEAGRRRWGDDLKEIWARRELLIFLIWRDIKVRYRETLLSGGWALFQPLMMTAVFTIFIGAGRASPIPYPIYVYSGLVAWYFFASAITGASMSVVVAEGLITKIYFPRLILPLATVGTCLVDFFLACLGLGALMLFYSDKVTPGWSLLLLPVWVFLCASAGVGVGTLWAALNVRYKDFRFLSGFLIQVWMFSTPSIFIPPTDGDDAPTATIFGSHEIYVRVHNIIGWMNPVNSLIFSFREIVLFGRAPWEALLIGGLVIALLVVIGCVYFRRVEDNFADVI
jgi:lipopolysaccharide transport system permease protein